MKTANLKKSTKTAKNSTSKTAKTQNAKTALNKAKTAKKEAEKAELSESEKTAQKEADRKQKLAADKMKKQIEAAKKAEKNKAEKAEKKEAEIKEMEDQNIEDLKLIEKAEKQGFYPFGAGIIPTDKELIFIENHKESGRMQATPANYKKIDLKTFILLQRPKNFKNILAAILEAGKEFEISAKSFANIDKAIAKDSGLIEKRSEFELFEAMKANQIPEFEIKNSAKDFELIKDSKLGDWIEIIQPSNMRSKPAIISANNGYTNIITIDSTFTAITDEAIFKTSQYEIKEKSDLIDIYGSELIEALQIDFYKQINFISEILEKEIAKDAKKEANKAKKAEKIEKQNEALEAKIAKIQEAKDLEQLASFYDIAKKNTFKGGIRKEQIEKFNATYGDLKKAFEDQAKKAEKAENKPELKEADKTAKTPAKKTAKTTTKTATKKTSKKETNKKAQAFIDSQKAEKAEKIEA